MCKASFLYYLRELCLQLNGMLTYNEYKNICVIVNSGMSSEALMQQLCEFVKESGYRIAYVPMATATMKRDG